MLTTQTPPVCAPDAASERTLALLLPAVVTVGGVPAVVAAIERAGLRVVVSKHVTMTMQVRLSHHITPSVPSYGHGHVLSFRH